MPGGMCIADIYYIQPRGQRNSLPCPPQLTPIHRLIELIIHNVNRTHDEKPRDRSSKAGEIKNAITGYKKKKNRGNKVQKRSEESLAQRQTHCIFRAWKAPRHVHSHVHSFKQKVHQADLALILMLLKANTKFLFELSLLITLWNQEGKVQNYKCRWGEVTSLWSYLRTLPQWGEVTSGLLAGIWLFSDPGKDLSNFEIYVWIRIFPEGVTKLYILQAPQNEDLPLNAAKLLSLIICVATFLDILEIWHP